LLETFAKDLDKTQLVITHTKLQKDQKTQKVFSGDETFEDKSQSVIDEELEILTLTNVVFMNSLQKGLMLMKKLLGYTCMPEKIRCLKVKKTKKVFWGPDMIYL